MSFSARKRELLKTQKDKYLSTFLLALLTAAMLFVPFIIKDSGYFLFYGDFNVQQIPFYKLSQEAILSGETAWSFGTDLGANFIGSYTFYLLGSPFFLLTLLFPTNFVPYLMGPMLILKFALAALTAYCFLRRFVRNYETARLGALLYAFSGFSVYNIFFNHFHEAIIIFPLVLLSLELLITENRRGFFAAMVAVSALLNYFFFFGIVVFTIIYWFVRLFSGSYKISFARFGVLAFEAIIGFLMSAILMLPSILALLGNSRITEFQLGWNAIMYGKEQIYANIFQCFFFPPDIPARPVFFPGADVKWASLGGWLPLFSMVGVFAVMQQKKKSFIRRLIAISLLMAMVPVLNSAFYMFNSAYYARWFYMPILIMCLATVTAIEDTEIDWNSPFNWVAGITVAIVVVIGLFPQNVDGKIVFGLYTQDSSSNIYLLRFLITSAIAVLALVALKVILPYLKSNLKGFINAATSLVIVFSMVYGVIFITTGKSHSYNEQEVLIDQLLETNVNLGDRDDFRIDVYDGVDNTAMFLGYSSINAFHSIVPTSVTEFWNYLGEERGVASRPSTNTYAARSLLSVKYLLDREGRTEEGFEDSLAQTKMPGFTYLKTEGGYKVYENKNYIPYGFTYDYYITRKQADCFPESDRANLLVKAMLLEDNQISKYDGILNNLAFKEVIEEKEKEELEIENSTTDSSDLQENEESLESTNSQSSKPIESSNESSSNEILDILEQDKQDFINSDVLNVDISPESLKEDAARARASSGTFVRTKTGFKAEITLEKDNLVFYSIPYDSGWSAKVNGKEVEIEKVNIGFMAVLASKGENTIEFTYKTPGLSAGIYISILSLVIFICYLVISFIYLKKRKVVTAYPEGEKMLENWENDIAKEQDALNITLPNDYWEEMTNSIKEEQEEMKKPEENNDGFNINLDWLDKE